MKLDLTTTFTSSLDLPTSRTKGITRKGSEMSLVVRYLNTERIRSARVSQYPHLMSSCSPSGGMKLIACSVSNLLSLTHLSVDVGMINV